MRTRSEGRVRIGLTNLPGLTRYARHFKFKSVIVLFLFAQFFVVVPCLLLLFLIFFKKKISHTKEKPHTMSCIHLTNSSVPNKCL